MILLVVFGAIVTQLLFGRHSYTRFEAHHYNGEMSKYQGMKKIEVFCTIIADCDIQVALLYSISSGKTLSSKPGKVICKVDLMSIDHNFNFENL